MASTGQTQPSAAQPNVTTRSTRKTGMLADGRPAHDTGALLTGLPNTSVRGIRGKKRTSAALDANNSGLTYAQKRQKSQHRTSKDTTKQTVESKAVSGHNASRSPDKSKLNPDPDSVHSSKQQHKNDESDGGEQAGTDSEYILAAPNLAGLAVELRQKIMGHLLVYDEPLLDIPLALAPEGLHNDSNTFTRDFVWLDNGKFGPGWRSYCRFKLYPEILAVCKRFNQEGMPLLYGKNTIGAYVLVNFQRAQHPYTYRHMSYCMGVEGGIEAALWRYPSLLNINSWDYRIYLGPGDDNDRKDMWYSERLHSDLKQLRTEYRRRGGLRGLSMSLIDVAADRPHHTDRPFELLMPFHVLKCNKFSVQSEPVPNMLPSRVVETLTKYTKLQQSRPMQEMLNSILSIYVQYRKEFRRCSSCHAEERGHANGLRNVDGSLSVPFEWLPEDETYEPENRALEMLRSWQVDEFYATTKAFAQTMLGLGGTWMECCEHAVTDDKPHWWLRNENMLRSLRRSVHGWLRECPEPE